MNEIMEMSERADVDMKFQAREGRYAEKGRDHAVVGSEPTGDGRAGEAQVCGQGFGRDAATMEGGLQKGKAALRERIRNGHVHDHGRAVCRSRSSIREIEADAVAAHLEQPADQRQLHVILGQPMVHGLAGQAHRFRKSDGGMACRIHEINKKLQMGDIPSPILEVTCRLCLMLIRHFQNHQTIQPGSSWLSGCQL